MEPLTSTIDTKRKGNVNFRNIRYVLKKIVKNKSLLIGGLIVTIITLIAICAPLIAHQDPLTTHTNLKLQQPSAAHLFGTDNYGRDLFSRVVFGSQTSIVVGLSVALITTILGLVIGLYSSYYSYLDHILMRICDGLMSFPSILLAIAIMAALGAKTENVIIALSIVYTPFVARVVRSSALSVKEQTYVEAELAQGASALRIIWQHIAPNVLSPMIVQSTFIFAEAIVVEASLSFLGVGVPAPYPSWGNIIYDGKLVIYTSWWMVVFPGLFIALSVFGLNMFGDGLRDFLDPKSKKR